MYFMLILVDIWDDYYGVLFILKMQPSKNCTFPNFKDDSMWFELEAGFAITDINIFVIPEVLPKQCTIKTSIFQKKFWS